MLNFIIELGIVCIYVFIGSVVSQLLHIYDDNLDAIVVCAWPIVLVVIVCIFLPWAFGRVIVKKIKEVIKK